MQQVKKSSQSKNFYFSICHYIKTNSKLPKPNILGIKSKQALNYYIKTLKQNGFINKIAYGTWEVLKDFDPQQVKEVKKINLGSTPLPPLTKEVRGHAFMFKIKIPSIRNWANRPKFLLENNITFKPLKYGQAIKLKGRKVHLYDNSIIIYEQQSYIANLAKETKSTAIYEFIKLVNHLEALFNVSFKINKQYYFRVCREHYALIKNCLAKQYDPEKKRLYVFCSKGLWFTIDNSYNLHEAETLLNGEAVTDNEGVQAYFNSHKATGFKVTPQFILDNLNALIQDRKYWAENQRTHVAAIQELKEAVNKLTKKVGDFRKDI